MPVMTGSELATHLARIAPEIPMLFLSGYADEAIVRQGGIHQEILDEAGAINADLIVMSSHRPHRPGIRTYFLGSNAGHVVRYAQCSVLVVRQ